MTERLVHIPVNERQERQKQGVVWLIVDPETQRLAFGIQKINNGRGLPEEYSLNGESSEAGEDPIITLARGIREELNGNCNKVLINPQNLANHYLGEAWFGEDRKILAHVFMTFGHESDFKVDETQTYTHPEHDFQFLGFAAIEEIRQMSLRPRMKYLLEILLNNGLEEFLSNLNPNENLIPAQSFINQYFN